MAITESEQDQGPVVVDERTGAFKEPFGSMEVIDGEMDEAFSDDDEPMAQEAVVGRAPVIRDGLEGGCDDYERYLPQFRAHYESVYHAQGGEFSDYEPAYRYGYDLAKSRSLQCRDWEAASETASADVDARFGDGSWDLLKGFRALRVGKSSSPRIADSHTGPSGERAGVAVTADRSVPSGNGRIRGRRRGLRGLPRR